MIRCESTIGTVLPYFWIDFASPSFRSRHNFGRVCNVQGALIRCDRVHFGTRPATTPLNSVSAARYFVGKEENMT